MFDFDRVRISRSAQATILSGAENLLFAPDPFAAELHNALAVHHSVLASQVLVCCGSTEAFYALASLVPEGATIACSEPSFPLYSQLGNVFELTTHRLPIRNYEHDFSALHQIDYANGSAVFLDSPNYITGKASEWDKVLQFAKQFPHVTVVYDNTYAEYDSDNPDEFFYSAICEYDNLLISRTFSKAHGLLGLRVGYVLGSTNLIGKIRKRIMPYSVNSLAQQAALASLNDADNIVRNIALNQKAKALAEECLTGLDMQYVPTRSNALLINAGNCYEKVDSEARARGLRFRDESKLGLTSHVQVHLIDPPTIQPFLDMLTDLLGGGDERKN